MAHYYSIEKDRIIIKPLAFLKPIGLAFIALFLLTPIVTLLLIVKGNINEIQPKSFGAFILVLPMLLACIPLFTYSRRQLIFDKQQQVIYLKTIFGQRVLLRFNEVADIFLKATLGMAYYLKSKADRYGKGYRISPTFANVTDKAKTEYESVLLPAIRQALAAGKVIDTPETINTVTYAGQLEYYTPHTKGYILKPANRLTLLPALIMFGLGAWFLRHDEYGFVLFVPITIIVVAASKRVVFDTVQKQVSTYLLGFPILNYPLTDFAGFGIVRKTVNGIYNGTDVRLKFLKAGSKNNSEVTLRNFGKTNPVEPFIKETEFVMKG
jgi:hypothetical protein